MRSSKATTLCLVSAILAFACCQPDEDYRPIVSGTYAPAAGRERIWVSGSRIRFFVSVTHDGHERKVDRGFEGYVVRPDGKIHPYPMRSIDNARGIGSYSWYWMEDGITQRERKTGKDIERFERLGRSGPRAATSAPALAPASASAQGVQNP